MIGARAAPQQSTFSRSGSTLNSNLHLDYNNPTVVQAGFTTCLPAEHADEHLRQPIKTPARAPQSPRAAIRSLASRAPSTLITSRSPESKPLTSGCTFAAVTSRSYHFGLVNVLLMDGSVRSVTSGISPQTWHALGTRASGDLVGPDY